MNPRSVINFFKTPAGAFLGFCVILGVIFFAANRFLPGATQPPSLVYSTKAAAADASKQTMQTYQNDNFSPLKNPPPAAPANPPTSSQPEGNIPGKVMQANSAPKSEALPITLFAETPTVG